MPPAATIHTLAEPMHSPVTRSRSATAQNRTHQADNRDQEISAAAGMRVQLQVQHGSDAVEVQQTCQRSRRPFSEYWEVYCEGVQRA